MIRSELNRVPSGSSDSPNIQIPSPSENASDKATSNLNLVDFEQLNVQYDRIEIDEEWQDVTCKLVKDIALALGKESVLTLNADLAESIIPEYYGRDEFLRGMLTPESGRQATELQIDQFLSQILAKLESCPEQFSVPEPSEPGLEGMWRFAHDQLLQNAAGAVSNAARLVGNLTSNVMPATVQPAFSSLIQFSVMQGAGTLAVSQNRDSDEINTLLKTFSSSILMSQLWQFMGQNGSPGDFLNHLGSTVTEAISGILHGQSYAAIALRMTSHLPGLFSSVLSYTGGALPEVMRDFAHQWNELVGAAGISKGTLDWISNAITAAGCLYLASHAVRGLVQQPPVANTVTNLLDAASRVRQMLDQVASLPEKLRKDQSYSGPRQITDASVAKFPKLDAAKGEDMAVRGGTRTQPPEAIPSPNVSAGPQPASLLNISQPPQPNQPATSMGDLGVTVAAAAAGLAIAGPGGGLAGGILGVLATADARPIEPENAAIDRLDSLKTLSAKQQKNVEALIQRAIYQAMIKLGDGQLISYIFKDMLLNEYVDELKDLLRVKDYHSFQPTYNQIKQEINQSEASESDQDTEKVDNRITHKFLSRLTEKVLNGEQMVEQITPLGKIEDNVKLLLSDTPPMLTKIENELNTVINRSIDTQLSKYHDNNFIEELSLTLKDKMKHLAELRIDSYKEEYEKVRSGDYASVKDKSYPTAYFGAMSMDYHIWFTDKHQQVVTDVLAKGMDEYISAEINKFANNPELILKEDIAKAGLIIDENIENLKSFIKEFDYIGNINKDIDDKIKSIPGFENKNGTDTVRLEKKDVRDQTIYHYDVPLREIACGAMDKRPELRGLSVENKQGIDELRKFPDSLQSDYLNRAEQINSVSANKEALKKYQDLTLKMNLRAYLKTDEYKKLPVAVKENFTKSINGFLKGDGSVKPLLLTIREQPLSNIIALQGESSDPDKKQYLLISTTPQNCVILPNLGVIKDKEKQTFLLSHLSSRTVSSDKLKTAFDEYIPIKPGLQHYNIAQVQYTSSTDYQDELVKRFSDTMRSNVDTLLKTKAETTAEDRLAYIRMLSILTIPLSFMVPGSLAGVMAMLAVEGALTAASLAISYPMAKTNEERKELLTEALVEFAFSTVGELIPLAAVKAAALYKLHKLDNVAKLAGKSPSDNVKSIDDIFLEGSFKKPENIIVSGKSADVYKIDENTLVKVYKKELKDAPLADIGNDQFSFKAASDNGVLKEAKTNARALNLLYGDGAATVMTRQGINALERTVEVKMRKIPGESIESLLKTGDAENLTALKEAINAKGIEEIVEQSIKKLKAKGILHQDINAGNILFDPKTNQFNIINFDRAEINPRKIVTHQGETHLEIDPLDGVKTQEMRTQFRVTIGDSLRGIDNAIEANRVRKLRPLELEIDSNAQLDLTHCLIKRGGGNSKACSSQKITGSPDEKELNNQVQVLKEYIRSPQQRIVWMMDEVKILNYNDIDKFKKYTVGSTLFRAHHSTRDEITKLGVLRNNSPIEKLKENPKFANFEIPEISKNIPGGADHEFNKYLQAIFVHTATAGTEGRALSMSGSRSVSSSFRSNKKNQLTLVKIKVKGDQKPLFMTTPDVIKTYGGYALKHGIINKNILGLALFQLLNAAKEKEVFFMGKYAGLNWGELPVGQAKVISG
ncbi:hypothetical protein [Winslowiella iniecta]|uniref:Kinase OspG kinase domain-containing protein n=1 Tax=Winslowiella iniecta TaxID=1560201 RepID=A0A0L7T3Z2_9GAMM|nr:hypothetical protein [Winslowiella iniecta]KOC87776.1 hypothetical protein NG42_18925 [Winslowiella iniecta]KOC90050.1 hypothetical protein NG43_17830 [Winslowiella iniecta]